MSVLITGFAPFDGADINPSWEAVRLVPASVAGQEVRRLMLPVEYDRAAALLKEAIARVQP